MKSQEHFLETCDPLDSRQFLIAVKKLADDLSYGTDSSPFLGSGVDYVQSRAYEIGDPIKSIDWRVTARTGKYHVKQYEAPKRMPVYLLVDTSASMAVASTALSKYAWAVQIAGGIALAALDRVSPVGVVGVGGRELKIKPSLARDRVMQWLHQLRHYRLDEPTQLGARLAELVPSLPTRALIITLSDLHDPAALPALKLAAQQHDCVALQLIDPAEAGLSGAGFVRVREAESGAASIARAGAAFADPTTVAAELKRAGIDHLALPTDQPMAHKLRHFFKSRALLGRGAR
jgi:uncharacterized protein (DUF58 family)